VLAPAESGGKSHCLHNALVGAATADVPVHVLDDLFIGGFRSVIEKRNRGKNHSRSAVAALESFCLQKSPLHRMESVAASKAFDGRDLFPDSGAHLGSARANRRTIGEDGARAALALSAAVFRSGKLEVIAQDIKQSLFRRYVCRVLLPVNQESKGHSSISLTVYRSTSFLCRVLMIRVRNRRWRIAGWKTVFDRLVEILFAILIAVMFLVFWGRFCSVLSIRAGHMAFHDKAFLKLG